MSEQPLIAVLDYGIGNLRSAQKALQHCGADARLTVDHGLIADADAVVLPGVGAFGACMAALRDADLEGAVEGAVHSGKPLFPPPNVSRVNAASTRSYTHMSSFAARIVIANF